MLIGFKSSVETGENLSEIPDLLWLLGIVLSGIGFVVLIFTGRGLFDLFLSLFIAWLWPLLIFDPQSYHSLSYLLVIITAIIWTRSRKKQIPH